MLGHPAADRSEPRLRIRSHEAYPVFRIIPTTGRPHTSEQYLLPTHLGDSTARWEGDTLVVDVISFNGEGWLASAQDKPTGGQHRCVVDLPAMHVVERWRRIDADTLEYRATVEDPEMLTNALGDTDGHLQASADRRNRRGAVPAGGWPETYLARLGS